MGRGRRAINELAKKRRGYKMLDLDTTGILGFIIVILAVFVALAGPLVAPNDPLEMGLERSFESPSWEHPFGTDNLGRDVFSRILAGARYSVGIAVLAAIIIAVSGLFVGILSGFGPRWLDGLLMRLVDGVLAFPNLILALAIAGILGGGLISVMLGLTGAWWAAYARLVRGMVLQIREQRYIEAARATGTSKIMTACRHVLPNLVPTVLVIATLDLGALILAVSALSFLGIGAQPPTPEWGAMLNDGRRLFLSEPQLMMFPGAAIFVVVLGFNLLGDALRDLIDPKGGR